MKICFVLFALSFLVLLQSCTSSGVSGPKVDLKGYQTESIGGGAQFAEFYDSNNWPLAKGHVIQQVQNGAWTNYHPNSRKINKVTNYINGQRNGLELTLNERGQVTEMKNYRNGELHGVVATYRNGRPVTETTYAEGKVNGPFAVYNESNGKIQRSGTYKDGQFDGELYYYGPNEQVTLKYLYKDGEKVSGGIVDE